MCSCCCDSQWSGSLRISEHCTALQFNSSLPGRLWMEASRSSKDSEFWILTASNGRRCFCRSGMWGWSGWGWSRATRADFLPKTDKEALRKRVIHDHKYTIQFTPVSCFLGKCFFLELFWLGNQISCFVCFVKNLVSICQAKQFIDMSANIIKSSSSLFLHLFLNNSRNILTNNF